MTRCPRPDGYRLQSGHGSHLTKRCLGPDGHSYTADERSCEALEVLLIAEIGDREGIGVKMH